MNTTHTRAKRLLVTAIGAAVMGIGVAAAPGAAADVSSNPPSPTAPGQSANPYIPPSPPMHTAVIPPPPHNYTLPPNKTQSGWK